MPHEGVCSSKHTLVCSKAAMKFSDAAGVRTTNSVLIVAPEKIFIIARIFMTLMTHSLRISWELQ